eukprot:s133_g17.t1
MCTRVFVSKFPTPDVVQKCCDLQTREAGGKPARARATSKPSAEDLDGFDAESFTVLDTERSQREDPAVMALLQTAWAQEIGSAFVIDASSHAVEYFPEVIRASRAGKNAEVCETWSQAVAPADLGAGSMVAPGNSQSATEEAATPKALDQLK